VVPRFDYLRKLNICQFPRSHYGCDPKYRERAASVQACHGIRIFRDPLPITRLGKLKRSLIHDMYVAGEEPQPRPVQDSDKELAGDPTSRERCFPVSIRYPRRKQSCRMTIWNSILAWTRLPGWSLL